MSDGKDDFLGTIADELERAKAEDVGGRKAEAMLTENLREKYAELERIRAIPVEPPEAGPSERVEHVAGVGLPVSITLDKLPTVQLDDALDPRRAQTMPSLKPVVGGTGSLSAAPAAHAIIGGRTVGGHTARFKEGHDASPSSAPPSEAIGSHELPAAVAAAPADRRWVPFAAVAALAAIVVVALLVRSAVGAADSAAPASATAWLSVPSVTMVAPAPEATAAPVEAVPAPTASEAATPTPSAGSPSAAATAAAAAPRKPPSTDAGPYEGPLSPVPPTAAQPAAAKPVPIFKRENTQP